MLRSRKRDVFDLSLSVPVRQDVELCRAVGQVLDAFAGYHKKQVRGNSAQRAPTEGMCSEDGADLEATAYPGLVGTLGIEIGR